MIRDSTGVQQLLKCKAQIGVASILVETSAVTKTDQL